MDTITRGNPGKIQGNSSMALYQLDSSGNPGKKAIETALDAKEQFLIWAYRDLVGFVTDLRATRTTNKQRMDWRRSYSINWLYDLVNVFSPSSYNEILYEANAMPTKMSTGPSRDPGNTTEGSWVSLSSLESFFVDGVVPTSNFREALLAKTGQTTSHLATRQRQAARAASQGAVDIHGLLDLNLNSWFNKKSNLILYRMVDWNPDAISDNDETYVDPETNEPRFKDSVLVRSAKAFGIGDSQMLHLRDTMSRMTESNNVDVSRMKSVVPEGYSTNL
ncbi:hypothetical protein B0T10DRAFT_606139 [Thelonectria olida]|uniref:Uncharacterized protein n=1 Tax=Thelonectria olida TaxID=1576542 RepID=A0A9P8W8A2_9HYPO|nr:hypothetical protein B0T10DRAFT_606139 [Thelonectria olida]